MNDSPAESEHITTPRDEAEQPQALNLSEGETDLVSSLTRLLVGGALIGLDELRARLEAWEVEAREASAEQYARAVANSPARESASSDSFTDNGHADDSSEADWVRHALLGVLFESQSRWARRRQAFRGRAGRRAESLITPLRNRLESTSMLRPAQSRFDMLAERGEMITRRWVARGQAEEAHSRRLVRTAANEIFSDSMDQLGQAPALQELVRRQSAGLTQDALDEVRVRTVTGDLVAEHLVRRLLRRTPRQELPVPSTAEGAEVEGPSGG